MAQNGSTQSTFWLTRLHRRTITQYPAFFAIVVAGIALFFASELRHFRLDASSDSIVLENDADLLYYNYTRDVFGSDDYVVITVEPKNTLLSEETLGPLREFVARFEAMESVDSVTSILSVPLFQSPPIPLLQIATGYKTLASPDVDKTMAFTEFVESPLYQNYLVSPDGKTTAVQVNFKPASGEYKRAYDRRRELREKARQGTIAADEKIELARVDKEYTGYYAANVLQRRADINHIREVVEEFKPKLGTLHIGGVPMIMADIIEYVRNDILVFGSGVLGMVVLTLAFLFRHIKWFLLITVSCMMCVAFILGYMGLTDWAGTIVSSNAPSLLIVVTLAMGIHFGVRYRELYAANRDWNNRQLVEETVRQLAIPCLYTSLTTLVGFGSLVTSGIRPVIDFGVSMAAGLAISYVICFTFLPAALLLFPREKTVLAKFAELEESPTRIFATLTKNYGGLILVASVVTFVVCAIGATRLEVENRFIDYFQEDTEIYQGMTVIDERIGGTTPLEVVLEGEGHDYWLTDERLARLAKIHDWLDSQTETGKVISPTTMVRILEKVNGGNPVPVAFVQLGLQQIPMEIQRAVVGPYVSAERDQVRISMRVYESDRTLRRKELVARIKNYLDNEADLGDATAHITGVFVLYNNMLQSLYRSQIVTLGLVFAAIYVMFLLLFRSFLLAFIAIVPNILPIVLIFGVLGWAGIPLDMMTIMIASVTMGLAVDFAIHYIHRFKQELAKDKDYVASMYRTHNSIGVAIFYTTLTTVVGFGILVLSNFNPSIYFGVLTSLALTVAFIASLTVLPLMIIRIKPFSKITG